LVSELADYERAARDPTGHTVSAAVVGQKWDRRWGWTNLSGASVLGTHINAAGLRATDDTPVEHPMGKARIEIFGDSFAFGVDVADSDTYAAQLERRAPEFEVLNFGVPGYGLDQCLLRFRQQGVQYRPDVVVIGLMPLLFWRSHSNFEMWYKPY